MKTYLLTIGLLVFNLLAYSQNIYQIRADSVRIYNDCDTAELIIENHTQMVPGFLYNKGRGRTEFRRMRLLNLGNGLISIGDQDTLDLKDVVGGGSSSTLADLQHVTDTGNITNNTIVITADSSQPETGSGLELSAHQNDEYGTAGLMGNLRVVDRDNGAPGILNVDARGIVLENSMESPEYRARLITDGNGAQLISEYKQEGAGFHTGATLYVGYSPTAGTGGKVNLGGVAGDGSVAIAVNGALGLHISTSRNQQMDYMARDACTFMVKDAALTQLKLYEASFCPERVITIKKAINASNVITISIDGAGKIDNANTITLTDYLGAVQLQSDGTNWWILYRYKN